MNYYWKNSIDSLNLSKNLVKTIYWYKHTGKKNNDFEKDLFKLMKNAAFRKTTKNVKKHNNIVLVTIQSRRNYFVSKWNHTTQFFSENVSAKDIKKHKYSGINQSIQVYQYQKLVKVWVVWIYVFW